MVAKAAAALPEVKIYPLRANTATDRLLISNFDALSFGLGRCSNRRVVFAEAPRVCLSGVSNCHAALPPLRTLLSTTWLLRFPLRPVPCLTV